jgi:hydrogenase-4 component F
MGILVLGIGLGGAAVYGAFLHLINNGFTKGALFLSAGNIHRAFGSKSIDKVRGAIQCVPVSASLFLMGFLAIAGTPPFGPFTSEFTILNAAVGSGQIVAACLYLLFLAIVFIGMGATVLAVVQGQAPEEKPKNNFRDNLATNLPIILFMALVLLLGLYIPPPLESMLREAAASLEAKR